nr:hypothetical protein [Tanacetum cinerariifolium]
MTALVYEHLDARLGATRDEFMNFLSASITARITEQVKNQLPRILLEEVSNIASPLMIQRMVTESLDHAIIAKESSQPQSSYEAAASLTKFELKKILIDKMDKSKSYLAAPEHKVCYDGLVKSYELDKTLFSTYDNVYSLKKSRKDKDKDEDPSASQSKSSRKSIQSEEPEFEVTNSDMPQDQKENPEPIDPDKNDGKTPQQGPTQSRLMPLASPANKPSKTFDELMSTPIDFFAYIMNGMKISNLTQETLLGPAFKLLKGTRSNYAVLEYDFEECYKALSEKLDWDNPEGCDYLFDLTKPLPLVMNGNRQMSPVKVAYDKHSLWGTSHWRYQRKSFYGYARGLKSRHDVYSTKRILAVTWVEVMRKHGHGYLREIGVRRADNDLYTFKEGDFPRLRINDLYFSEQAHKSLGR